MSSPEIVSRLEDAASHLRHTIRSATAGLVGREQLAELIVLAAVAQEHLLVIGPPGTGKSAVVRRVAQAMGGRYFEYLLGRFTEPSELFGAVDLKKLREGTVETDVTGMLPEADVAFLDEVFLGSTAILNTLLTLLNERRFRRGHTQVQCPLRVCVGAANALPDDESLSAFGDRFLIHVFVDPLPDHQLETMLAGGWRSDHSVVLPEDGLMHLDTLSNMLKEVQLDDARRVLANAVRKLRQAGIQLSDRRIVKTQGLMAAAAVLAGRIEATAADLWPLLYSLPTRETQLTAREVLGDLLAASAHPHLFSAVELATMQPLSRAGRLREAAEALLSSPGADSVAQAEAVLREIDANFTAGQMPKELSDARSALMLMVVSQV
jgi:MoxR-like ATPase